MKTIRLYDSCADYELAVDGSVEGSSLPKNSICYCKDAKKVGYSLKIVGTTDKTEPFNLYINGIDKATYKSKAQQVSVKDGFFELALTSKPYDAYRMFGGDSLDANHTPIGDAWNIKSVIRLDGVDNLKSMQSMFEGCVSLGYVNCGGWDTSKVTNMRTMFQGCSGLTTIDVSHWNTSNVTDMRGIFSQCRSVKKLDVSGWDTSKVTDMNRMFLKCRNVKKLDVSKWDVSKVTKFEAMFGECYSLTELDLSGWDLSSCEEDDVHLFSDIKGSENKRNGDLTTIKLGKGFFKAKTKEYTSANLTTINWSRESMMESLYTNQIGRDVTDVKNLYLRPEPLSRLSEEDIAKIKSVGIILIKSTSGG